MKKVLRIFLLVMFVAAILVSCKVETDNGADVNSDENTDNANAIYAPGIDVSLVVPSGKDYNGVIDVYNEIYAKAGVLCKIRDDSVSGDRHEIVFGDTSREISKQAKAALNQALGREKDRWEADGRNISFLRGYLVYAKGNSVAIVWTDEDAQEFAIDYFVENYLSGNTLKLDDGYKKSAFFDYIETLRADEQIERENMLAIIKGNHGSDVADALKEYLSLFDERFYLWLADLYDPGEYDENGNPIGGGFYYSNSGRNTKGYGIDLESTAQVMTFLTTSGMAESNSQLKVVLPQSMFREIAAFVKSCQSSYDGYFYHPQWGMNVGTTRLSRDLGWATRLLGLCGESPYWDTPNNVKGSLGAPGTAPTSMLSGRLSQNTAIAVSKVVTIASNWTGSYWLADLDAWEEYLVSFKDEIRTSSYSVGDSFDAQKSQIIAREKMAIENGELRDSNGDGIAEGGYIRAFEKYFNQWQISSNGLWEEGSVTNGTVTFGAINGLMKISAVYNSLGIRFNYADKAFSCAAYIAALMGRSQDGSDWGDVNGELPEYVVNVYNPWAAMSYLVENVNRFASPEEAESLRSFVKQNAAELITVTTRKISKFKKEDGSFCYSWTYPSPTSSGADVSVPFVVEGDVNGGTIAVSNTYIAMCSALGIGTDLKIYAYSDLLVFANRIENLDPVIKVYDGGSIIAKQYTFDDDNLDEAPNDVITKLGEGASLIVAQDPEHELNRYVKYDVVPGGHHLYFNTQVGLAVTGNAFEFKIKFEEITKESGFQIRLGDSYMLTVNATVDGTLKLGDMSNTSAPIITNFNGDFNAYDWNEIRVEFYVLDPEAKTTIAHIYVNGELRFTSTNYFKKEAEARPVLMYKQANIYSYSSSDCVVYIDDVSAYQIGGRYEDKPVVDPYRIKDFEDVTAGSGELPYGVATVGGQVVSEESGENTNNVFVLDGKDKSVNVLSSVAATSTNCYSLTLKMLIEADNLGVIGKLHLAGSIIERSIMVYELEVYEDNGTKYARLTEINSDGDRGNSYEGIPIGEWFALGLEFYPYFYLTDACAIVYLNGNEIGRGKHYYKYGTISTAYNQFILSTSTDVKISLDDITPEGISKMFTTPNGSPVADPEVILPQSGASSNTPASSDHNGVFDFEDAEPGTPEVPGLTTTVNRLDYGNNLDIAVDPKDAVNKVLMHKVAAGANGNSEIFAAAKKVPSDANCYVYEFDILASSLDTGVTQIALRGKHGNDNRNIFQASLYTTGDWMSEAGGTLQILAKNDAASVANSKDTSQNPEYVYHNKSIVPTIKIYGWVNIRFEVYPEENIAQIYIDNEFRAEIASVYSVNAGYAYENAYFFTTAGSTMTAYLDNVKAVAVNKNYFAGHCDNIGASAGEDYDPSKEEVDVPNTNPDEGDVPGTNIPTAPDGSVAGGYFGDSSITNGTKLHYDNLTTVSRDNILTSDSYSGTQFEASVVSGALKLRGEGVKVGLKNSGAKKGAAYVLETYVSFDGTALKSNSTDTIAWVGMSASGVDKTKFFLYLTLNCATDENGNIQSIVIKDDSNGTVCATLDYDGWSNIRFIYRPDNTYESDGTTVSSGGYKGNVEVYVDDEFVSSFTTTGAGGSVSNEQLNCIGFEFRGYAYAGISGMNYYFDNTFIGVVDAKEDSDNIPTVPEGNSDSYFNNASITDGTKLNYDDLTTVSRNNILTSDSYVGTAFNASVVDGALSFVGEGVNVGFENSGAKTANTYVFESYILFDGMATGTKTGDTIAWFGMSAGNLGKSNFFLRLRFDYTADSNGEITSMSIVDDISNTVVATIAQGKWHNIRLVYRADNTYEADGITVATGGYKGNVEVYVDNVKVTTYTTSGASSNISNEQLNCVGFEFRGYAYAGISRMSYFFDNTFIGAVEE